LQYNHIEDVLRIRKKPLRLLCFALLLTFLSLIIVRTIDVRLLVIAWIAFLSYLAGAICLIFAVYFHIGDLKRIKKK
jgi:hypothetical protein